MSVQNRKKKRTYGAQKFGVWKQGGSPPGSSITQVVGLGHGSLDQGLPKIPRYKFYMVQGWTIWSKAKGRLGEQMLLPKHKALDLPSEIHLMRQGISLE